MSEGRGDAWARTRSSGQLRCRPVPSEASSSAKTRSGTQKRYRESEERGKSGGGKVSQETKSLEVLLGVIYRGSSINARSREYPHNHISRTSVPQPRVQSFESLIPTDSHTHRTMVSIHSYHKKLIRFIFRSKFTRRD